MSTAMDGWGLRRLKPALGNVAHLTIRSWSWVCILHALTVQWYTRGFNGGGFSKNCAVLFVQ